MRENLINYRKAVLIFIGLVVVSFLAYRYLAPFGKIVYYRFTSKMPGAQEAITFSPGKDNILKIPAQIITSSKSRLQLKLLSPDVESIEATIKFKPTVNEIKLGVKGSESDVFFYQPLYRDLLRDLNWHKVEESGFFLWQKEKKYQTLYDFVNNPPLNAKTASYFIDQEKLLLLEPSKTIKEAKKTIDIPLRGSHTLLVRVDKGPLILKVTKQDMNVYEGDDKFKITVLKDEKQLIEKIIEDDGVAEASRLKTEPQEETATLEDIEPGIYQANITYEGKGGDSLITKIEVNQPKVIFKNRILFLGDKPTKIWTNVKKLNILTAHEPSLQTVKLDEKHDLEIKEVAKQYSFDLESLAGKKEADELYKLESPKNDLTIEGKGYFSFSSDAFFLPKIIEAIDLSSDVTTLTNLEDIDYILTTHLPPKKEGDWLIAETSFDPKKIKIEDDKLYFSLEVPQIAKYGGELEIDYLEIAVKSKGILEKEEVEEEKPAEIEELEKKEEKNIFVNIINRIKTLFVNLYSKMFTKKTDIPKEKSGDAEEKPSPTPSPSPSPTPTPAFKSSLLVRVLNGGAEKGTAGKFAEMFKNAGFTNVLAANADNYNYKNATIKYREGDKEEAEKISKLLKKDYETLNQKELATTSAEIVVIVGEK